MIDSFYYSIVMSERLIASFEDPHVVFVPSTENALSDSSKMGNFILDYVMKEEAYKTSGIFTVTRKVLDSLRTIRINNRKGPTSTNQLKNWIEFEFYVFREMHCKYVGQGAHDDEYLTAFIEHSSFPRPTSPNQTMRRLRLEMQSLDFKNITRNMSPESADYLRKWAIINTAFQWLYNLGREFPKFMEKFDKQKILDEQTPKQAGYQHHKSSSHNEEKALMYATMGTLEQYMKARFNAEKQIHENYNHAKVGGGPSMSDYIVYTTAGTETKLGVVTVYIVGGKVVHVTKGAQSVNNDDILRQLQDAISNPSCSLTGGLIDGQQYVTLRKWVSTEENVPISTALLESLHDQHGGARNKRSSTVMISGAASLAK
jgi:hypothetical protein